MKLSLAETELNGMWGSCEWAKFDPGGIVLGYLRTRF
jgi:hypothetical protein